MSPVNNLINSAFEMAFKKYPEIHEKWIRFSHLAGAQLPHTHFLISIQDIGHIDLLLRALEDENLGETPLNWTHQRLLSNLWIGSCYEVFRVINQKIKMESEEFKKIYKNLTLIRIGIEKHEIASDRKLKEPLKFVDKSSIEQYEYNSKDETRGYSMATGISNNGSIMWEVLDIDTNPQQYWLERKALSNNVLALFND